MARKPRVHFDASDPGAFSPRGICGWPVPKTTLERSQVTCLMCTRRLKARDEEDRRSSYVSHASFLEATIEPLTRTGTKSRRAALFYALSSYADAVIANDSAQRHPVRRTTAYASTRHALAELVRVRLDGYGQRSLSDPNRLEALTGALGASSSVGTPDDRAARQADNLVHVDQALTAAYTKPWDGIAPLTPGWCRFVLLVRHVAKKTGIETAEIVAELLEEGDRALATPSLVARIARHGYDSVSKALTSRQLVEPEAEGTGDRRGEGGASLSGEDEMAGEAKHGDLHGWTAIADFLGVDERTARRYEAEGMPTHRFRGRVEASSLEIRAWRAGQTKSSSIPAARKVGT